MDWSPIISGITTFGAQLLNDVRPVLLIGAGLPLAFWVISYLRDLFLSR